jgi:hypothetical protein
MIDKVLPDGVVPVHRKGDLKFCADAIDRRHQHRLAVTTNVEREQPAKPAHFAEHFRPMRRRQQSRQSRLHPVAQIDVDSRARVCFLCHAGLSKTAKAARGEKKIVQKENVQRSTGSNGIVLVLVLVLEIPPKTEDENENEDEDETCSSFWAWFLQSTFQRFSDRASAST